TDISARSVANVITRYMTSVTKCHGIIFARGQGDFPPLFDNFLCTGKADTRTGHRHNKHIFLMI
ncbi:hypothetical protein ET419_24870, partial [Salmonella enterica]|nr:hypothetical protein [Salmonella enterica]